MIPISRRLLIGISIAQAVLIAALTFTSWRYFTVAFWYRAQFRDAVMVVHEQNQTIVDASEGLERAIYWCKIPVK